MMATTGQIVRIAGPVVGALGLANVRLYDVVRVGTLGLVGEVIRLDGDVSTIQVYEETNGVKIGEPVTNTGAALAVDLGPGLLGTVYDGLQRPLEALAAKEGHFLSRGTGAAALDPERRWQFSPSLAVGTAVASGDVLGFVQESATVKHAIMVPYGIMGRLAEIAPCTAAVDEIIAVIETEGGPRDLTMRQRWPVRTPRPFQRKLKAGSPLITGTRMMDAFCPVAKGGSAIIPGGFGTGKTVIEQGLARWSDVDIVVYIGCGERGNEMAEVLNEFPTLADPRNGAPLMDRTILIANTSNMPVAAREASIYTGITLAEYYRDMGLDVLLLADSTSRWGEALREISGRLEEMPGEEGYPAYLGARLTEFYERSGRVLCGRGNSPGAKQEARFGSITIVGAVSPPAGDFSEPVTQDSLRVTGTLWALDYDLSRRRHFPAINWLQSYTLYDVNQWFREEVAEDWPDETREALVLLQKEQELQEIVKLVGPDTLAEEQRMLLAIARMLREDFLQQSALDEIDRYSSLPKTYWMLHVILAFNGYAMQALAAGLSREEILADPLVQEIARMKSWTNETAVANAQTLAQTIAHKTREGSA
jgi:V/A-type H+-transporting ATPase subunit A